MADVVLINAPIVLYDNIADRERNFLTDGDELSFYPINLLYIASYLMSKNYTVKVIDPTAYGLTLIQIIHTIIKDKPALIGITAMTASIQSAVRIAKEIKCFDIPTVLGGIHISNDPGFIRRFPVFDYGVVGDGEITMHKIITGIEKPGLVIGGQIEDLDSLPFPRRDLVDINRYKRPEQIRGEPFFVDILTSRGCAYSCSFCSIHNHGKKVRYRSAKNVVDEMEQTYYLCQGNFTFNDDCFTLNKSHVMSLAQEIIDRKMKCSFMASTRANCIDEEMMKALKRMGCRNLCFGVESGSERIRNEVIGKKVTDKQIGEAIRLCRKHGITASLFLMVGLPTETKEDMQKTIEIGPRLKADYIGVHQTTPYPGSRIYEHAIEAGKIPSDLVDQWASGKRGRDFRKAWAFYVPEGFTQKDITDYKRKVYLRFYFDLGWIMRKIWQWIRHPRQFIREDLKLFKLIPQVIRLGGTKGQFS